MGDVATRDAGAIIEKIVTQGDVASLTGAERADYYNRVCEALGLNPLTQPFEFIKLNGKLRMYAKREAAEQLRKINGISIDDMETNVIDGVYIVKVKGSDKTGRNDIATGAVPISALKGDNLANAMLKAETKAKRRLTLSISGLGMLDEHEVDSIPEDRKERTVTPDPATDEALADARTTFLKLVAKAREIEAIDNDQQAEYQAEARDSKSIDVLRARYKALNKVIKAREAEADKPAESDEDLY